MSLILSSEVTLTGSYIGDVDFKQGRSPFDSLWYVWLIISLIFVVFLVFLARYCYIKRKKA